MTSMRSSWSRAGGLVGLAASLVAGSAVAQVLPQNPDMTCVAAQDEFNGWFAKKPGLNQAVTPADSLNLDTSNNCNFYKWSAQMFLWLTSPAGLLDEKRVFRSSAFYQVNNGDLVKQDNLLSRNLSLSATKFGPDGLPFVMDAKGRLREFVSLPDRAGLTASKAQGGTATAEIATVRTGSDGKAEFLNAQGKLIEAFTPKVTVAMLPQQLGRLANLAGSAKVGGTLSATDERQQIADALTAKKVLIEVATQKGPVFVEAGTGAITNLSPGQAGGDGVLVSRKNAIVFYEVLVNDVYAWYLTGRKTTGGIAPTFAKGVPSAAGQFPTAQSDLAAIVEFANANGGPSSFSDGNALAVEVKLSWVDASTLPNAAQGYITAEAELPGYDTTNPEDWAPTPAKKTKVALVGAHIVGSTKGHPEMVWATFEHQANAPFADYTYLKGGVPTLVKSDPSGSWTFSDSSSLTKYNEQLATFNKTTGEQTTGHIVSASNPPAAIGPNNVLREKAWGVASDGMPNQTDATPAAAATQIISLNTDVRSKLTAAGAATDPRFNYLLIGATWTVKGGEPTGSYPKGNGGNEIGTSMLTNSTMETFMQGTDSTSATGTNCFTCHVSSGKVATTPATTHVSHIFGSVNPLPLTTQPKVK